MHMYIYICIYVFALKTSELVLVGVNVFASIIENNKKNYKEIKIKILKLVIL